MSKPYYGPRWGQTNKWGKPKCKTRTYQNGGLKHKNKSSSDSK
jgi:hypothetical protein